jgi:ankyrin repeat protein
MPVDRVISHIKNHPLVAFIAALGTVVVTLSTFTDAAKKLFDALAPERPAVARSELSKLSLAYTPRTFVKSAEKGDLHAVKLFLTAGMDPNASDPDGITALMHAVSQKHTQIMKALLKAKANVNAENRRGDTVLSWAAEEGDIDTLRVLLASSAHAQAINGAFIAAAGRGHRDVMRFLLDRGADMNQAGTKALRAAAGARYWGAYSNTGEKEQSDTIRFLLDVGVDVDTKDKEGLTPLMLVIRGNADSAGVVHMLLDRGADLDAKCDCSACDPRYGSHGCTALMIAASQGHRKSVLALLGRGADVNERTRENRTALMLTGNADSGNAEIVRALLGKGADTNIHDTEGRTALMWMIEAFAPRVDADSVGIDAVHALLERGADVHAKDNAGRTALSWAASGGWEEIVRTLLKQGVDINPKTVKGRTPLMLAALNGYPNIVRILMENGAHLNEKDIMGKTALQLAQEHLTGELNREARDEIVHLLRTAGAQ